MQISTTDGAPDAAEVRKLLELANKAKDEDLRTCAGTDADGNHVFGAWASLHMPDRWRAWDVALRSGRLDELNKAANAVRLALFQELEGSTSGDNVESTLLPLERVGASALSPPPDSVGAALAVMGMVSESIQREARKILDLVLHDPVWAISSTGRHRLVKFAQRYFPTTYKHYEATSDDRARQRAWTLVLRELNALAYVKNGDLHLPSDIVALAAQLKVGVAKRNGMVDVWHTHASHIRIKLDPDGSWADAVITAIPKYWTPVAEVAIAVSRHLEQAHKTAHRIERLAEAEKALEEAQQEVARWQTPSTMEVGDE